MKNLHLEKSVLSMLMYPENLILEYDISEADFTSPLHKKIFKAISQYGGDTAIISGKLKEEEHEDLREISSYAIGTFGFEKSLEELQELTEKRRIYNIAKGIIIACETGASSDVVWGKIHSFNKGLEPRIAPIKEVLTEIVMELLGEKEINMFKSGFRDLDKLLNFKPGNVVIIAARPSVGKTLFAMNVMLNQVELGKKCAFLSMEMSNKEMLQRILARNSKLHISDMNGVMDKDKIDIVNKSIEKISDKLDKSLILIDNIVGITELERNIMKMSNEGVEIFYIDYLGLIHGDGENRNIEISRITRKLKQLAMQQQITIFLLAQLNRDLEKRADPEPKMYDLRDSGSIEQDADIVIMLSRDMQFAPKEMMVFVRKNRNGELGEVKMRVLGSSMQVGDRID